MAYLQQFLLPSTSCLAIRKKLQDIIKGKNTVGRDRASMRTDSDIAAMLEYQTRNLEQQLGVPGLRSQLSVQLLVLAQVVISAS